MLETNTVVESILWFVGQMIQKIMLPKNMRKAKWNTLSNDYLLARLREEIVELENEMITAQLQYNSPALISECCDIANFAMMIADNAKRRK